MRRNFIHFGRIDDLSITISLLKSVAPSDYPISAALADTMNLFVKSLIARFIVSFLLIPLFGADDGGRERIR
jgi:hypothetical protein